MSSRENVKIVPVNSNDYEEPGALTPYDEEDCTEIIVKKNCKLCNSEHRAEAEQTFDQYNNIKRVVEFLKNKGEEISYPAVRNHLIWHYKNQQHAMMMQSYSEDIGKWIDIQSNRQTFIRRQIAALDRQANVIAIQSESQKIEDRLRSAETEKKLRDSIVSYEKQLQEMEGQLAPVTLFIQQINDLIRIELKGVRTEEAKRVLANVVDKIEKQVSQLSESI